MSEIAPEPAERIGGSTEKTNIWLIVAIVAIVLIVLCCCYTGLLTLVYLASQGELGMILPSLLV